MNTIVGWSAIRPGDMVLGAKDGNAWEVVDIGEQVRLRREEREVVIDLPAGGVTRLATADQAMARAIAVTQVILGGEVIARADRPRGERGHSVPKTFLQPSALAAHIMLFHGAPDAAASVGPWGSGTVPADQAGLTLGQLIALHDSLHQGIEKGEPRAGTVKHFHDPDFDAAVKGAQP